MIRSALAAGLTPRWVGVTAADPGAALGMRWARAVAYRSPVWAMRARTRALRCFRAVIVKPRSRPATHVPRTLGATAVLERTRWHDPSSPRTGSPLPPRGRPRGDRRGGWARAGANPDATRRARVRPVIPTGTQVSRSPARTARSSRFSGGASGHAHRGSKAHDGWKAKLKSRMSAHDASSGPGAAPRSAPFAASTR